MNRTHFWGQVLIILLMLSSWATAAPIRIGERIVRDPVTGDYTAYYWDEDEQDAEMEISPFITATKIEPFVHSKMALIENGKIRYLYNIRNGDKAKQSIGKIRLSGLPVNTTLSNSEIVRGSDNEVLIEFFENSLISPNNKWSASGVRTEKSVNISWLYDSWTPVTRSFDTTLGIKPGESLGGFGFISTDLPGVFIAKLLGNTAFHRFSFSGGGPDYNATDIARQMSEIVANDFVPRNIAAPLITVPTPFDPAIVLDNLRPHVATWPSKQLADVTFVAQLDAELVATANAYRANQPQVARDHIEILLDMIRREHKDIDRDDDDEHDNKRAEKEHARQSKPVSLDHLAARVLDFDLKYVLKRMRKDDEHEHDRGHKNK